MQFDLEDIVRENVKSMAPYSSARSEFVGDANIFLDANENSFGSPIGISNSRYPDPLQVDLKTRIGEINGVNTDEIFVGNGSDEAVDMLFRIFCRPGVDNVVICPPTYGMYSVAASINDVSVISASLTSEFALDIEAIKNAVDENTKLIFICSPNNPTGNLMSREAIIEIAAWFSGIVVVDEAYIHFSEAKSLISEINNFRNLIVLQTFSKAWGLAGLRVGLALGNEAIIAYLNKVKPPYNVSSVAQRLVIDALQKPEIFVETVAKIVKERRTLAEALAQLSFVETIYPSDANFLLVRTRNAIGLYRFLVGKGIAVRDRSDVELCEGCLRITIGTPEENYSLIQELKEYEKSVVY